MNTKNGSLLDQLGRMCQCSNTILDNILKKYTPTSKKHEEVQEVAKAFYMLIRPGINPNFLTDCYYSGSLAKGTNTSLGSDCDIFLSYTSTWGIGLENLYKDVYSAIEKTKSNFSAVVLKGINIKSIRRQNVSIGVTVTKKSSFNSSNPSEISIDVIPAKKQSTLEDDHDHSLFITTKKSWTKTNVQEHINLIKNSRRIKEIKLTKIWRDLNKLNFPSFYLELVVIEALKDSSFDDLSNNLKKIFIYLKDNFVGALFIDPANTGNRISDDLTQEEKEKIRQLVIKQQSHFDSFSPDWRKVFTPPDAPPNPKDLLKLLHL